MKEKTDFDVILVGGSYSGLAAAMALGRAMRRVLVIDSGLPCNRQTPHSHNFLTHDGKTPAEIALLARQQVMQYTTVAFYQGVATAGQPITGGFRITTSTSASFTAKKVIFATGIKDLMPAVEGFAECWGITVLHCPYCHGYEVRNELTGILGNGDYAYEFSAMISNWTRQLMVFTNGPSTLSSQQADKLKQKEVEVIEKTITRLEHQAGHLQGIRFDDGSFTALHALYARPAFEQHCPVPASLGCTLTPEGYLQVDGSQRTTVHGLYASGDSTTRIRTVANAVATGTTAGMMVNREIIEEEF